MSTSKVVTIFWSYLALLAASMLFRDVPVLCHLWLVTLNITITGGLLLTWLVYTGKHIEYLQKLLLSNANTNTESVGVDGIDNIIAYLKTVEGSKRAYTFVNDFLLAKNGAVEDRVDFITNPDGFIVKTMVRYYADQSKRSKFCNQWKAFLPLIKPTLVRVCKNIKARNVVPEAAETEEDKVPNPTDTQSGETEEDKIPNSTQVVAQVVIDELIRGLVVRDSDNSKSVVNLRKGEAPTRKR